ncbi:unnamed protein product [Rhizoctonia solani]|uniref:HNH nuclease domain-containing protein n=1 Tax=Rhizoctonia solani TaxID=456999 RepID=A0A8H3BMV0_9AGAM|nr:unnamed protein product [Rhizoctonia solani]
MLTFNIPIGNGLISEHYLQVFPHQIWEYHLIPFRPALPTLERFGDNLEIHTTYDHPFLQLEPLKSHVHPFFVVYNAGRKARYHMEKKKQQPDSDTDLVPEYLRHIRLCAWIYVSWMKQASETLVSDDISQPARKRSYAAISSGGSSSVSSEQQRLQRDEWTQRQAFAVHYSPQSCSGADAPQSHKYIVATSTSDRYLPTVEHSIHSSDYEQRLATISSRTSFPSCYWTNIGDWVEGIKSSAPCENPYLGGSEHAEQSLLQYSYEEARSAQSL